MNWIRRIMNKLFVDIDEDDITLSQIKNRIYVNGKLISEVNNDSVHISFTGDVEGDITANSVKVRGKHTGSISM